MKRTVFNVLASSAIFAGMLSLSSCSTPQSNSTEQNSEVYEGDNSKTSVDYDGIYRGTLPCADCEGIKVTIYINKNNTYTLKQEYITNKPSSKIEEKGTYTWDKTGSIITLKPNNNNGIVSSFKVGENTLYQLDGDGKIITGPLANYFILSKNQYNILNKKWKIEELYGKKFDPTKTTKNEGFLQLDEKEGRYSANAGCNTLLGPYKIIGNNTIELKSGISTMMACTNMDYEYQLAKVLTEAKSFNAHGDRLELYNSDQKAIATFRVPLHQAQ